MAGAGDPIGAVLLVRALTNDGRDSFAVSRDVRSKIGEIGIREDGVFDVPGVVFLLLRDLANNGRVSFAVSCGVGDKMGCVGAGAGAASAGGWAGWAAGDPDEIGAVFWVRALINDGRLSFAVSRDVRSKMGDVRAEERTGITGDRATGAAGVNGALFSAGAVMAEGRTGGRPTSLGSGDFDWASAVGGVGAGAGSGGGWAAGGASASWTVFLGEPLTNNGKATFFVSWGAGGT